MPKDLMPAAAVWGDWLSDPKGTVPCSSLRRSASPNSSSKPVESGATVKIACPLSVSH